ncbi:hypothetical protein [Streptomyces sp. NPDC001978]|uniref:hypothetical protein n=1 Tax=Streptomyces sp. NPDC001978 TaxID=3364627 RepID=UPI0036A3D803
MDALAEPAIFHHGLAQNPDASGSSRNDEGHPLTVYEEDGEVIQAHRPRKTLGWRTPAEVFRPGRFGHRCDDRSNPPGNPPNHRGSIFAEY